MKELVLASGSPYRKELLSRLGVPFSTIKSDVDESIFKNKDYSPLELTKVLSFEKAKNVLSKKPDSIILGSDQVVALGDVIFSKPGSKEKAIEQLRQMSGKTHQLITSVCLFSKEQCIEFSNKTLLTLRDLDEEEIERYIDKDSPLDCAGSYKIESAGIGLFQKIEMDDFTSIIGLPLIQLTTELKALGYKI